MLLMQVEIKLQLQQRNETISMYLTLFQPYVAEIHNETNRGMACGTWPEPHTIWRVAVILHNRQVYMFRDFQEFLILYI